MTVNRKLLLAFVFAMFALPISGQENLAPSSTPAPIPGNMKLLPGYVHKPEKPVDYYVGKIARENGLEITYEIGHLSGYFAYGVATLHPELVVWTKKRELDGNKLEVTFCKDNKIYASINVFTNFTAVINSTEDMADFFLIVSSYDPKFAFPDHFRPRLR